MKRIFKSMFLVASAVAVALNFASCKGDDGEDDNNNDDNVVVEKDGAKYTVKISDLNDNDEELSYTVTYNFIAPEEAKVEYQNIFKYTFTADEPALADSTGEAKPETADVVKDSLLIVSWKVVITCSKEEYAQKMYDDMKADSVEEGYASLTIDGKTITCVIDDTGGLTYAGVKALYEKEKLNIISDIEKAKKEAAANNNKPENGKKNTNTKTNYNFNKDSVGAIVNVDSTIGYTIVKSGVASVYSFSYDKNGNITSGTIVCECKNSEVAKAYAKEHMRDRNDNDERIYKSVSLDGNKVIMVYSDAALEGLTKDSIVDAQKSGSNPLASDSGSEQNDEESADAGDDNQSGEPETPATQE